MRHLFVDTFYLIALAHRRDQWRERVLRFSRSLRDYRLSLNLSRFVGA
jgi:hypothetical protein